MKRRIGFKLHGDEYLRSGLVFPVIPQEMVGGYCAGSSPG